MSNDGSGERAAFVVHDAVADEAASQLSGVTRLLGSEVPAIGFGSEIDMARPPSSGE